MSVIIQIRNIIKRFTSNPNVLGEFMIMVDARIIIKEVSIKKRYLLREYIIFLEPRSD